MPENVHHHFIVGQAKIADQPSDTLSVLAQSTEFSDETIKALQQAVVLAPLPVDGQTASQSIALAMLNGSHAIGDMNRSYVLARCHFQAKGQSTPVYQYVQIPAAILEGFGGDIQPLLALFDKPIPSFPVTHAPIEPLVVPMMETGALDKDAAIINAVLTEIANGDNRRLLAMLAAALEGGVIVCGFPENTQQRLRLIQGLAMLLPKPARSHLTFSTYADSLDGRLPRIVFSNAEGAPNVQRFDWNTPEVDETLLAQPYVAHLRRLWQGADLTLADILQALNSLALDMMTGHLLVDGLQMVVTRHQHDLEVIQGEPVATDVMLAILDSDNPPERELKLLYLEHLLQNAFDDRNTDAALRVAQEMDADGDINAQLDTLIARALETQPDAAYFVARTRLASGIDDAWLTRLHQAAQKSLDVAIESGGIDVLSSWLNLISREPLRYKLVDILRSGILAARKRAHEHPQLTQDLFIISVKRQPETLSTLLHDPQLMRNLPENILNAIEHFDSEAIANLIPDSRELFLLAVRQVIAAGETRITATIIRHLWEIQQQSIVLAPDFRPLTLIRQMALKGNLLLNGALEALFTLLVASKNDDLFFEVAPNFAQHYELANVVAVALQKSGRKIPELIDIISRLTSNEILDAQDTITTYTTLLARYDTPNLTLPLVEQLARVLVQYPETTASISIMWKIAELSGEIKSESMLRVSKRRLLHDIEQMVGEDQIIENVQRLRRASNWSATGRADLLRWWRQFTRTLGLVQLQKMDRILNNHKNMDDFQPIVQTNIALRRIFGQRTLAEVSNDLHTAFTILQAFSESFDPDGKNSVDIDSVTIRTELEARDDELSAEMRQILATNLKEIAQLITTLSENRSKPTILRSDDVVERQLYTGEAEPQSAIDVMRWLSGYLVGVQKDDDAD